MKYSGICDKMNEVCCLTNVMSAEVMGAQGQGDVF